MKLLLTLLLFLFIMGSSSVHIYHVWRSKNYKTLYMQLATIGIAFAAAILVVYEFQVPSISELMNRMSPFK